MKSIIKTTIMHINNKYDYPLYSRTNSNSLKPSLKKPKHNIISFIANSINLNYTPFSQYTVKDNTIINPKYFHVDVLSVLTSKTNIETMLSFLTSNSKGVCNVVINYLSQQFITESLIYLPQLISLYTCELFNNKHLETFLLDCCGEYIKYSLINTWTINALIQNENEVSKKRLLKLSERIESTLVNGFRSTLRNFTVQLHDNDAEKIRYSISKQNKLNYYYEVMKFYSELKTLCEDLKAYPKETLSLDDKNNRDNVLKNRLCVINGKLKNLYGNNFGDVIEINEYSKCLFRGIVLPFNDGYIEDEMSNIIVRIVPKYSFCFSTKERVPVKIVCECVRIEDCDKWNELYDKKQAALIDEEDKLMYNINDNSNNNTKKKISLEEEKEIDAIELLYDEDNIIEYKHEEDINVESEEEKRKRRKIEEKNIIEINKLLASIQYENEHPSRKTFSYTNKVAPSSSSSSSMRLSRLSVSSRNSRNSRTTDPSSGRISDISPTKKALAMFTDFNPFGSNWSELIEDIKASSPYKKFPSHSIKAFIAKSNDDLRQELLTMQLIRIFHEIFAVREGLFVTPYEILITSATSGLIEFLPDTISMDALKKKLYKKTNQSLRSFFKEFFKENLNEALINFAGSLAAYSLICYFLQIKDRHNGNILLDINAKLIHIDFGFILGISPGNNFKFETAPFKFTKDYIDILGGVKSLYFTYFRTKFLEGFITARKHYERFESVLRAMTCTNNGIPCFEGRNAKEVLREFRLRFFLGIKQSELMVKVDELIEEAIKNKRTGQYDWYQYLTNGIYY